VCISLNNVIVIFYSYNVTRDFLELLHLYSPIAFHLEIQCGDIPKFTFVAKAWAEDEKVAWTIPSGIVQQIKTILSTTSCNGRVHCKQ
jgi:hypothetical protein